MFYLQNFESRLLKRDTLLNGAGKMKTGVFFALVCIWPWGNVYFALGLNKLFSGKILFIVME